MAKTLRAQGSDDEAEILLQRLCWLVDSDEEALTGLLREIRAEVMESCSALELVLHRVDGSADNEFVAISGKLDLVGLCLEDEGAETVPDVHRRHSTISLSSSEFLSSPF